jgi:hypothetical protein
MIVCRYIAFLFCTVTLLAAGCGSGTPGGSSLDSMIPATVYSVRSEGDLAIPGTRLQVHHSDGLKVDSAHQTLYKDNLGSIRIMCSYGMQTNDSLNSFLHNLDSLMREDKSRVYYSRLFRMDSCPARLYYLKSEVRGEDQLVLSLEDETFSLAESTLFPASDAGIRDSLLKIMLSVYMKDQTPADVLAAEPFILDVSHTEFLYSASLGQIFLYTIGGKNNPDFEAGQDQFFVTKLFSNPGLPLRERAVDLLKRYAMAHVKILHYTISRFFIREEEAYELEGNVQFGNKTGKLFMVVMGEPERTLVLSALLYENVDQRLAEIIRITQSLEFKRTITH